MSFTQIYHTLAKAPKVWMMLIGICSLFGLKLLPDIFWGAGPSETNKTGGANGTSGETKPEADTPIPSSTSQSGTTKRLVSETTKKIVASKQKWTCAICQKMLDETYEIDHVKPLYKGGSNLPENLMALCPICHRKKTNRDRGISY